MSFNWNLEQHKLEDIKTQGDCCFNHIIGLPKKDDVKKAIFDYEMILYDALLLLPNPDSSKSILVDKFKHMHLWVKKATGFKHMHHRIHAKIDGLALS